MQPFCKRWAVVEEDAMQLSLRHVKGTTVARPLPPRQMIEAHPVHLLGNDFWVAGVKLRIHASESPEEKSTVNKNRSLHETLRKTQTPWGEPSRYEYGTAATRGAMTQLK